MELFGHWWGYCLRWWPMNVLQMLGFEGLCCQPLEVPLSKGEWVAQLLGPKRAKPCCCKVSSMASGLRYTLCAAFHPRRLALSCLGCPLCGQGCWGRYPALQHPQPDLCPEKCTVSQWVICKSEPIPSVGSIEGKSPQYFFVMGISRRNGPWEGTVAQTKGELVLFLCLLLPIIHHDYSPDPYTSMYTWHLATHQPSSFCAGSGLIQGKFPWPWRNWSKKRFPQVRSIIHRYPPWGPPPTISFPSSQCTPFKWF